jgi:hypothetical protein
MEETRTEQQEENHPKFYDSGVLLTRSFVWTLCVA